VSTKSAESDLQGLQERIEKMEAEIAESRSEEIGWDDLPSAAELAKKQARLDILPRILAAAKRKRLELQLQADEKRLVELKQESAAAHAEFAERQAERFAAEQAEAEAINRRSGVLSAVIRAEEDIRHNRKQLAELKEDQNG
jgi:FKBP-type peptidyl-prolyl cis-trans isomerase